MASIGIRILELLKEKGISQREFSDKTGIPQSTISDWRGKKLNPNADRILKICEVLEISVQDLLSGEEQHKSVPLDYVYIDKNSKEYNIIIEYRKLNRDDKRRLEGYLEALKKRV